MQNNSKLRGLGLAVLVLLLFAIAGTLYFSGNQRLNAENPSEKQGLLAEDITASSATGGRSRGGSFSRPSAPSAPARPSNPSRSAPRSSYRDYEPDYAPRRSYPPAYYPQPGPVIIPVPANPGYIPSPDYSAPVASPGIDIGFVFLLLVLGFAVLPIIFNYLKLKSPAAKGVAPQGELLNDVVTVTRLQIALLAQARQIQKDLTELTLQVNPETPEGLREMLQETVLALLRSPENWTHVRASSQTVPSREQATQLFEQLSLEERSKFSAETLVNIGGRIRRQSAPAQKDEDSAAYIIVTLLIGSADDKPLIKPIYSAEDLQAALQRIGSIPPEYLLVYELLWSPQDETDSLSQDEMIAGYPDLVQIS